MLRQWLPALIALVCLTGCSASTAFYMQGNRALAAGDYDRAVHAFSSALIENPQHVGALTALGIAQYRRGAFSAALEALERAQYLDPYDPSIQLYLGLSYLRLGQPDQSRQHLSALLERMPNVVVREQAVRAMSVTQEANLSDGVREYVAYSLEQTIQQEQRVAALADRVRTLETQQLYRPAPQVIQSTRCR